VYIIRNTFASQCATFYDRVRHKR